ncbi:substrate-binding domain-containing protein [Pseudomonas aeruginosa]
MNEFRRLAAKIDQHMQQLAAQGVSEAHAIINRMMGYGPDLHRIWVGTSDQQLMALSREFPGFYPEVTIAFFETSGDDLMTGLEEGRYDAGISLRNAGAPAVKSQPLWVENVAVAMPLGSPLLAQAKITLAELLDYPVFRWPAEACLLLDQRLSSLPLSQQSVQHVTSFEMMALWVTAGYGVGLSAQSRMERAHAWGSLCDRFQTAPTRS